MRQYLLAADVPGVPAYYDSIYWLQMFLVFLLITTVFTGCRCSWCSCLLRPYLLAADVPGVPAYYDSVYWLQMFLMFLLITTPADATDVPAY